MVKVLGQTVYPVPTAPRAFDIVRCAFPTTEIPYEPAKKYRPGLVLAAKAHVDKETNLPYATLQVAYGTSQPQNHKHALDVLHVHNFIALERSGLCKDTWFCLDRIAWMFWSEEYFPIVDQLGTAILGHLPHDEIVALQTLKKIRDEIKRK